LSLRRVRPWDWVAALVGIALQAVLGAEWYGTPDGGVSGWSAFAITDVLIALAALSAILLPLVVARFTAPAIPVAWTVIATALTFLVLLLLLYRLVNQPGPNDETSVSAGAWIGAGLMVALLYSLYRSLRDQRMPAVPGAPEPQRMPAPARVDPGHEPPQPTV
jgi:hypothetical protein